MNTDTCPKCSGTLMKLRDSAGVVGCEDCLTAFYYPSMMPVLDAQRETRPQMRAVNKTYLGKTIKFMDETNTAS